MKIGIMQPYFLPYIGYFALINIVNYFVYLDDVQYIRRGWINKNRIKINDSWKYVILPVKKSSLATRINEIQIVEDEKNIHRIIKTIEHGYRKAPFYDEVINLISITPGINLSKLNIRLINNIIQYLNIGTKIVVSSKLDKDHTLKGEERIINICQILKGNHYINPIGGLNLYSKSKFQEAKLKLSFLKMKEILYSQGKKGEFIPNLSIIDLMMWNSKKQVIEFLDHYQLV